MTLRVRTCKICKANLGKEHDCNAPALHGKHIRECHPDVAEKLGEIHDKIKLLEREFYNLSGRFASESYHYSPVKWLIESSTEKDEEGKPLYWSNRFGWVDLDSATKFFYAERTTLDLPVGGEWKIN